MTPEYLSPLANHLWQSTIVTSLAAFLAWTLRKNAARVRYWLWFIAAAKFLIPFSILVGLGHQFEWRTAPVATQGPIATVAEIGMPFEPIPVDVASSPQPEAPTANSRSIVLLSIWLFGFALSVWLWLRSWLRVRAVLNLATPINLDLTVTDSRVRTMSSPALMEPAVFGIFKPVLLLPDGITDRMNSDQLKAVLAHELCHVRRRDNLRTAVYMVAETLLWFYPLVRWIGSRLVDERERACDEEVLRLGNEPIIYAEGIVGVCKGYLELPFRCASGVTGSDLKRRIRSILDGGAAAKLSIAKKAALVTAAVALLAVPIVVGSMKAAPKTIMPAPAPTAGAAELLTPPLEKLATSLPSQETKPPVDKPVPPAPKAATLLFPQTPAKPKRSFEVASIKPIGPFQLRPGISISGNRFDCAMSLEGLMTTAYQIKTYQISGPDWLNAQRFEINATIPEGSSKDQVPAMLQSLLEDRFKLKAHLEKKDQPVYALVVPKKDDLKLMKADETGYDDATPLSPNHPISGKRNGDSFILIDSRNGMVARGRSDGRGSTVLRMEILKTSMPALADSLTRLMDRPVVDATGLKEFYKMTLDLPLDVIRNAVMGRSMPADAAAALGRNPFSGPAAAALVTDAPAGNASDPPGKAVFAAIEKVGLKLESRKGRIETLIVEGVEKSPTEN